MDSGGTIGNSCPGDITFTQKDLKMFSLSTHILLIFPYFLSIVFRQIKLPYCWGRIFPTAASM